MEEKMRIRKALLFGATLLLGCALVAAPLPALAAKTLKLAHLNSDDPFDNATGAMATVFKSLVEAGTNGSVEVQIFGSGQLGKDSEVLQQVKAGVVQSTFPSPSPTSAPPTKFLMAPSAKSSPATSTPKPASRFWASAIPAASSPSPIPRSRSRLPKT